MVDSFNGIKQCLDIAQSKKNGCLQVKSNGITWNVFVKEGRLQYAVHSIQTFETIKYCLNKLGYRVPEKMLDNLQPDFRSVQLSTNQVWLLYEASNQLYQEGVLDSNATQMLKLELSKDALESLFWLRQATYVWLDQTSYHPDVASFSTIINQLKEQLKIWQRLSQIVSSPYQRPYCPDRSKLSQPVPNGILTQTLLQALAQLMNGNNIQQLASFVRQDTLKFAQLLNPYIQQQYFILKSPVSPYDKLPNIPAPNSVQAVGKPTISPPTSLPTHRKVHKIVCIDDSPAMLETIQGYLGSEGFDVATVENPMESMSTLFSMKPDLILMDVSMPGINGNRLCTILRRSSVFKKVPIIMVSSNTSVLDKAKSESSGATDYLTKPFSKADLLAIVEEYLSIVVAA
ncbi:response regulator [Leptothoe sp. ISB3NOV94-8A]